MKYVLFSCCKISYTLIRVNLMSPMNDVMTLSIITTTFYENITIIHVFSLQIYANDGCRSPSTLKMANKRCLYERTSSRKESNETLSHACNTAVLRSSMHDKMQY